MSRDRQYLEGLDAFVIRIGGVINENSRFSANLTNRSYQQVVGDLAEL